MTPIASPVMHIEQMNSGTAYLEHLTEADLSLLGPVVDSPPAEDASAYLRSHPELVEEALGSSAAFELVLGGEVDDELLVHASPFLVFAVAVHRTVDELGHTSFVEERITADPRRRRTARGPTGRGGVAGVARAALVPRRRRAHAGDGPRPPPRRPRDPLRPGAPVPQPPHRPVPVPGSQPVVPGGRRLEVESHRPTAVTEE